MADIKRGWDILSEEKKKAFLKEFITFFAEERGDDIGLIAAENFLDFFTQNVASEFYNKGVEDAREFFKKKLEDLDLDMEVLVKK